LLATIFFLREMERRWEGGGVGWGGVRKLLEHH